MTTLLKKLNYKVQNTIFIINHPLEFNQEMTEMKKFVLIKTEVKDTVDIDFILVFVKTREEIDHYFANIANALNEDCIVWFSYPKGTSKKYKVDINRDHGWEILGKNGFETVRAVAIDNDWSALRFRKTTHIKTLTRNKKIALSEEGKSRTQTK